MTDAAKKAFDLASEAAKQLITVSTAVIAFAALLMKDFVRAPEWWQQWLFALSLIGYMFCILFGLLGMFQMADDLDRSTTPSIFNGHTRIYILIQLLAFGVATICVVAFGITAIFGSDEAVAAAQPTPSPVVTPGPEDPTSPTESTESPASAVVVTPNKMAATPKGETLFAANGMPTGTPIGTPAT